MTKKRGTLCCCFEEVLFSIVLNISLCTCNISFITPFIYVSLLLFFSPATLTNLQCCMCTCHSSYEMTSPFAQPQNWTSALSSSLPLPCFAVIQIFLLPNSAPQSGGKMESNGSVVRTCSFNTCKHEWGPGILFEALSVASHFGGNTV